ncbi:hypothetical protein JCM33374_g591 [Metschnikowia sp. JCM 33374]|nr:hypothetical protein JCM33374_g591 [Metschnikowia sp. JCM 33374]
MDDYNRFVVLLSHHPLAVPYQMLLKYYTILPRVLPLDKQALLRTLIFHDAWGDFWSIVLSENATLTDLEETVELIGACLSSNKNTELGIWLALSAAKKEASNNNIYSSIREVFEYKFRISTAKLQLFDRIYATPIDSLADQSSSGLLRNEKLRINQNIDLKAFLIVRFALESENVPLVAQFILEQCQDDPRLHKMPGFVSMALLKTLDMHLHDRFVSLFKKAIHSKHDTRVLLSLVELSSTKGRTCQRKTLKILGSQKDYIEQLLGYNFTEYNLTEIWRYGIRQNILDSSNTGKLFQKTISRSWNAKELTKRSRNSQETSMKNGFREQFRHATFEEKRRLKVRLQAMAQALSSVEASQISMTLNYLRAYLLESNHGVIIQDQFAKKYILHHFIKYTMKFIYRSGERGEGVSKMRAVLKGLHFDSIITQASIFEYMTMDKPKIALDILENYKKKTSFLIRPIMSGIEKGILTSKLEKHERLLLFQEFQERKARLGFNKKLDRGTMALMGNLIFDVANQINDKDELKELIRLAYEKGVPVKIIQKWSAKL